MRSILRRFFLEVTLVLVLTLSAFGVTRVASRASAVMYGTQPAVLAMKQENSRLTVLDGDMSFSLPPLSSLQVLKPALYFTPLGSVLGFLDALEDID